MRPDWHESSGLNRAWIEAEAALPAGWHLDSIRCASTGLAPDQRSERWLALATGPNGKTRQGDGEDAISALEALARELRPVAGRDERQLTKEVSK